MRTGVQAYQTISFEKVWDNVQFCLKFEENNGEAHIDSLYSNNVFMIQALCRYAIGGVKFIIH